MKFNDLDQKMRVFETAYDLCVLPGLYMVARLDGRGFTRLTKEVHQFEAPFDSRFRDLMVRHGKHFAGPAVQEFQPKFFLHRDPPFLAEQAI